MHIFSLVVIAFFFLNIYFSKIIKTAFINQLAFTAFISMHVEVGYFMQSDLINIDYWQICIILTFIVAIPLLASTLVTKKFIYYVYSLLISVFLLMVFPVKEKVAIGAAGDYAEVMLGRSYFIEPVASKITLFYFALSIIQAFVVMTAFSHFEANDWKRLISKLAKYCTVVVGLVVVETVLKHIGIGVIYQDFINLVFGTARSTYADVVMRGDSYMLQGLTREGSHFVYAIMISMVVLFTDMKLSATKRNVLLILIGLIEIIFSMAFNSILSIAMLVAFSSVYMLSRGNSLSARWQRVCCVLLVIFMVVPVSGLVLSNIDSYYIERFNDAVLDVSEVFSASGIYAYHYAPSISSTSTRIYSIVDCLGLLAYRPLFGIGIGTTFCHGSTALFLGENGIIGLLSYAGFYFSSLSIKPDRYKNMYLLIITVWLVGNLLISGLRLSVRLDGVIIAVCTLLLFELNECEELSRKNMQGKGSLNPLIDGGSEKA